MYPQKNIRFFDLFLQVALYFCAYVFLAFVSYQLSFKGGSFPSIWLPSGLFISILLLSPKKKWPTFLIGTLLAEWVVSTAIRQSFFTFLLFLPGVYLETGSGVELYYQLKRRLAEKLKSNSTLFFVLFSLMASSVVYATYCTGVLTLVKSVPDVWLTWRMIWLSHLLGSLTLTPFILTWRQNPRPQWKSLSIRRWIEWILLSIGLVICSFYVFVNPSIIHFQSYLVIPFLLWATLRFGPHGFTLSGLFVTMISLAGNIHRLQTMSISDNAIAPIMDSLTSFLATSLLTCHFLSVAWERGKQAEMALLENRTRLQTIFDHSPMCIWEEDFSSIKQFVDTLKDQGITDLRGFLHQHPEIVIQCEQSVRVLDINQTALNDIQISTKPVLMNQLSDLMARGPHDVFIEEIVAIAEGKTEFQFEGANDLIDGVVQFEDVRWMVEPGYKQDYGRLIVTLMNVTERRLAEEKTRYLSTHDVLTGLYNRNFFEAELDRLQHSRIMPMNILIADVNGLKQTNDTLGHFAGDELLRQAAQALRRAFRKEDIIARTGGDEFTVLFPGNIAPQEAEKRLYQSVAEMNQMRPDLPLSLAIGAAASECGQPLLETYKRADQKMYGEKARIKNSA